MMLSWFAKALPTDGVSPERISEIMGYDMLWARSGTGPIQKNDKTS